MIIVKITIVFLNYVYILFHFTGESFHRHPLSNLFCACECFLLLSDFVYFFSLLSFFFLLHYFVESPNALHFKKQWQDWPIRC